MDAAAIGVAEKEDDEQGIDQQDVFYRVVFFLAAITLRLFSRVLGADDAPFGPVMGKRGEPGAATGAAATGAGLLQRRDHGGRVGLRDAEPLRQGRQGAGGGIAEGAQRRQQRRQQDVNPLIGFALAHAEQPPLHHLEGVGLQVDQDKEQPIFGVGRGQFL